MTHVYDTIKLLTGWSDEDVAEILGVSKQLVQKRRAGSTPTYHTAPQRHALIQALKLFQAQLEQGLAEVEMFL